MPTDDPMAIARVRIAEEAERRTGTLDLHNLGLTALPDELFALTHLRSLDLGANELWRECQPNRIAAQMARIAGLAALEHLDVSNSDLQSLEDLRSLTGLQTLHCERTRIRDLAPIAGLHTLQTIDCGQTQVRDLAPVAALTALQSFDCSFTNVQNLTPLAGLHALQTLDCNHTLVVDLSPIAGLEALRTLVCRSSQVADLASIAALFALQTLDCDRTQIRDLAPLAGLRSLQTLLCSGTQVQDLSPLAGLRALQTLECDQTQVQDLAPLADLQALHSLSCWKTKVQDLTPLAGLQALQILDCGETWIADLAPLAALTNLHRLNCGRTQVADLAPLTALNDLQALYCWETQVTDLAPLAALPALRKIDCSRCHLKDLPSSVYDKASLQTFIAFETRVPDLPSGVLSPSATDNCLPAIRAHFADDATESAPLDDIRLLLLGNGRVGKTQIARWLAGRPFEEHWDSTHGIRIVEDPEPGSVAERLHLHMWDFGGQDIYHGTHALFLRGPAVVVPVWATDRENGDAYEHEGLTFRNHPLAYWLDVVRQQADRDSPVLILQNKCDTKDDEVAPVPIDETRRAALGHPGTLCVSPRTNRRRAALEEELTGAITELRARFGRPRIGTGRLRVQRRLEAMREADLALPPDQRRHRLIERSAFDALCAEEGGVSEPDHLLAYLDANGTVLYRQGLFHDRIVLDLGWALDAVYAVFDRTRSYAVLTHREGRFTRPDLGALVWQAHGPDDQKLLLSLMVSCGMCFPYRRFGPSKDDIEYVAPDLLPGRASVAERLQNLWDDEAPGESATFRYALLHGGLIRVILSEIGGVAGSQALYWRGGLYGYERETRGRLIIEEVMTDGWQGMIRIRTQRGQAAALLDKAIAIVERAQARLGMRPEAVERSSFPISTGPTAPLVIIQEKPMVPEWYVSYAWGDATPEGRDREDIVDRLCAKAKTQGRSIARDKTTLNHGDSISDFMARIGAGDRVFVFLSDKYLRSPFCMFELSEVWRNSRRDEQDFTRRVRLFTLPGAPIWTVEDRTAWGVHWKQRHDKLDAALREHGHAVLGESGLRDLRKMQSFYLDTADILAALANRVQPRTFEDFVKYGFDDPPP